MRRAGHEAHSALRWRNFGAPFPASAAPHSQYDALHARGCDPGTAFLAAGAAMLAQQAAFQQWTRPGETRTLRDLLSDAVHALGTTVGREPVIP